ncbi:MAG: hypothetical protein QNJ02_00730 [Desulfobacterales bacterium]|nr:hypothetical protein [Desulfobacterales bacterium]
MFKEFCLMLLAGLLMMGCADQKPEEVARQIVDQQVAVHHEGFEMDTSRVAYKVIEQDGDTAMVEVSGDIAVKAVIFLTKKEGQWVLNVPHADKAAKDAPEPAKHAAGH